MTPADVRQLFLDRLGLRLGPEMSAYVLRRMSNAATSASARGVPVIAGDARTGRSVRAHVALAELAAAAATPDDRNADAAPSAVPESSRLGAGKV